MSKAQGFPPGFRPFTRKDKQKLPGQHVKMPTLTVSRAGYLILNAPAAALVWGKEGKNRACAIAYNPSTSQLAIRPERKHLKPPDTYKVVPTGPYRRHGTIGFKTLSRVWNIPLSGRRFSCVWDEERKLLLADLSKPL